MPGDLIGHWSKRRAAIIEAAREMGFTVEGNAPRAAAANKITRAGKSPDNDPEIRHGRWPPAEGYVEREALIASLLGKAEEITHEQIRALTEVLEELPYRLPARKRYSVSRTRFPWTQNWLNRCPRRTGT